MSSTARPTVIFHTRDLGPAIQAEAINSHLLEPSTSKENSCLHGLHGPSACMGIKKELVKIEIKTEETDSTSKENSSSLTMTAATPSACVGVKKELVKIEIKTEETEIKQEVKSENDIIEVKSEEVEGVNFELVPKVESTCSYSSSSEDEWGDGHVLEISVVERFKLRECTVTLERWHPKLRRSRRVKK